MSIEFLEKREMQNEIIALADDLENQNRALRKRVAELEQRVNELQAESFVLLERARSAEFPLRRAFVFCVRCLQHFVNLPY